MPLPHRTTTQNRTTKNTALSLLLVVGVLFFLAGLFGLVLQNAAVNTRTAKALSVIDVAGRQRTLVQRMTKDAFAIEAGLQAHHSIADDQRDLADSAKSFNQTLLALMSGGTTADTKGAPLQVERASSSAEVDSLRQVQGLWVPVFQKIKALSANAQSPDALRAAAGAVATASNDLLNASNAVTTHVSEAQTASIDSAGSLRFTFITLAVLGIVLLVSSLFSRLQDGSRRVAGYAGSLEKAVAEQQAVSRELAEAKRGSDLIMQTVNQGLLLVDDKYRVQPQYSTELEKIFQTEELAGRDLMLLLQSLLTERLFNTTRDYMGLLFDPKKKERAVLKVNPLDEVECSFSNQTSGGFTSKFLSFNFRRIVEDGRVARVFVAVNDITDRVQLERQLREAEQKKERQFELLLCILHIEPLALDEFIATAKEQIHTMNDTLRAQDFAAASAGHLDLLRKRLDTIFRCVHNIKGNAALIKFEYFEKRAEEFESKLSELRNRTALGGDDFLSVVIAQSEMRSDLEELEDLRSKFSSAPQHPEINPRYAELRPADEVVVAIGDLANSIASKLGKEVRVDAAGFETHNLNDAQRRAVKDVLIQLTRNSLTHGVEVPDLRELTGKQRHATLTIRPVTDNPNQFGFVFRDDGRGFDTDRIRNRAIEQGMIASHDPRAYDDSTIVGLIFEPGFSTTDEATSEAGRGMGMNIVKQRIIDEFNGDISVLSEPGRFCEFKITLPTAELAHA